jgi:Mg-chelatase subunit ChlI
MQNTPIFHYPFSAVIEQTALKTALLLIAIEPKLGGLLISGNRGSAKSTLARGLADLLAGQNTPFVNLPLGITEDRLLGSLNLEKVLADGTVAFQAGLFAKAHNGILYVDEINLLGNHLVDLLLDVSASGVNYLERDGLSHQHSANFLLVGTMNPEEGELRPQLLDRFGLSVHIYAQADWQTRLQIVQRRLQFDDNPSAFLAQFQTEQKQLQQQIQIAQTRLADIYVSSSMQRAIAERCYAAQVEGVRADLALYRAARAYAALHNESELCTEHIDAVVDFVLQHRQIDNTQPHSSSAPPPAPSSQPSSQTPSAHTQTEVDQAGQDQMQHNQQNSDTDDQSNTQGDWGEMPTQASPIGLQRKLAPSPKKKP